MLGAEASTCIISSCWVVGEDGKTVNPLAYIWLALSGLIHGAGVNRRPRVGAYYAQINVRMRTSESVTNILPISMRQGTFWRPTPTY